MTTSVMGGLPPAFPHGISVARRVDQSVSEPVPSVRADDGQGAFGEHEIELLLARQALTA